MAHFAQIDKNGVVSNVVVVDNTVISDAAGVEHEQLGIDFCKDLFGADTNWVQTHYSGSKRGNYAGVGFKYDPAHNAFIPPQPFPSWTLETETFQWEAPVSMPADGKMYIWDEPTTSWVEMKDVAA
jgi:hypothetical protein